MLHAAVEHQLMPATYLQHLFQELPDAGALLHGSGLEFAHISAPDRYITVGQNLRCIANAFDIASAPDWYLNWGRRMADYIHGPLTAALLSAPTLGHGLDAFSAYFDLRIPYMSFRASHAAGSFTIELVPRLEVGVLLPLLIEIPFLILQHYIANVRNAPIAGARIELAYPRPRHAHYEKWFGCAVHVGAPRHALTIPSAWRAVPNLGHDDMLWRLALKKCETLAAARAVDPLLARLRNELDCAVSGRADPSASPTLTSVADRLHVSSRTLIRRLRTAGTTFQDEIDGVRARRAAELLCTTDISVGRIAELLGFSDAAGFNRAFKRWRGVAPGEFRKSPFT